MPLVNGFMNAGAMKGGYRRLVTHDSSEVVAFP